MSCFKIALILLSLELLSFVAFADSAEDFTIYSVNQKLNLGYSDEIPQKDYFINMGSEQGIKEGTLLKVLRKMSSYDLINQQLYHDFTFPIALIKVIHVENSTAIARLEKLLPVESTPAISPRAIMVGDRVSLAK